MSNKLKPYVWHSIEDIDFAKIDTFDDLNMVVLGFWGRGYDSYTKVVTVEGVDFFDDEGKYLLEGNPDKIMIIYDPIGTDIIKASQ